MALRNVEGLEQESLMVLHHHERVDGKGYPGNLRGSEIPLGARIIAVADSFDAMTSDRPYRPALPAEQAVEEVERCAGTQFDPEVVRAFVEAWEAGETPAKASPRPRASIALAGSLRP